jgi:hypothetical protein
MKKLLRTLTTPSWGDVAFFVGAFAGAMWAWEGAHGLGYVLTGTGVYVVLKVVAVPIWSWYDRRHWEGLWRL